jgi:pilus assembly protein CpaE
MAQGEKIRVVIVDDIAETRENIRKLLQFEEDVEVAGAARTGREGIDLAKELKPDVLLMDINMPDMDGITATNYIKTALPYAQIIMLSVQSDPNYMRRAMQAGACDFLAKPPTVDELTSAVRRAGKIAKQEKAKEQTPKVPVVSGTGEYMSPMGGRVITIYSPKGGVGCTVLATNLAIALHNEDTPVVLVDANLHYGDVAISVNEKGKFSIADLTPRVDELDAEVINDVLLKHAPTGVKILAAPARPEYADAIDDKQFSKVVAFLRQMFSYIVIDTASALTPATLAAIDSSDLIILVATQDIPAIKNAHLFLELADALAISRKKILFVMNRVDKRIAIEPLKIAESMKQELIEAIPLDERTVVPSLLKGTPFILGDKSRPVCRSVLNLSEAVRKRLVELETAQEDAAVTAKVKGKR